MPYTKLLNQLIDNSGLTVKEIAQKCTEDGVKVTPAYISTLRNDTNNRAPSETMSKAIARACGSKNEDILVVEGYIDGAPEAFKSVIEFLRESALTSMLGVFANKYTKEEISIARKAVEEMPLAGLIIAMSEGKSEISKAYGTMNIKSELSDDELKTEVQLKQAIGFDVTDNSMFPTLPKGAKVTLEMCEEYKDGDILAFVNKDNTLMYRKAGFIGKDRSTVAMFPLNTEFETKVYSTDEINIIGKVVQVIVDIK
ncbi:MAG: S24 family peptidase [Oscillospiraceae bacterium]|nr:S24 family peptidase [Oscillospiraceae bacterium]